MMEKQVAVVNETGLHARPAADFVKYVKTFKNNITLTKDNKTVNAKSILHLLSLSLKKGDRFTVRVEGEQEEEVLENIIQFVEGLKE